jgi:very-short-patch-repair endonuclease
MELELAAKLESSRVQYQTQVEVPITIADFYFTTEPRPTLVFVDGKPHLTTSQMIKDEELRSLLRKRGYKVVELAVMMCLATILFVNWYPMYSGCLLLGFVWDRQWPLEG